MHRHGINPQRTHRNPVQVPNMFCGTNRAPATGNNYLYYFGVPYYNYGIMGPKTLFKFLSPQTLNALLPWRPFLVLAATTRKGCLVASRANSGAALNFRGRNRRRKLLKLEAGQGDLFLSAAHSVLKEVGVFPKVAAHDAGQACGNSSPTGTHHRGIRLCLAQVKTFCYRGLNKYLYYSGVPLQGVYKGY